MTLVTIKNLVRRDLPIYYRRLYTGIAVLETVQGRLEYRLDFAIEQRPTGVKDITVTFIDKPDFPPEQALEELKRYIGAQDSQGSLPD